MTNNTIICPECGNEISVDDAIRHQIEDNYKKTYEDKQKQIELEISKREKELAEREKLINKSKENIDLEVSEKLKFEKTKLTNEIKEEFVKENKGEISALNEKIKEKEQKLDEARKIELELRKERVKLEDDKKSFELEKQRQLDEERKKIEENAFKKAAEEQHFVISGMQKKLEDALKANEDLNRKLQQGSQQTQGEILELELEDLLRASFPYDEIISIAKGVNGADILQKVHDHSGRICGSIIWESKHTKAWSEGWIQKLKDDQRKERAEVAIIVSTVLPPDIKHFDYRSDVIISDVASVISLANLLRVKLQEISLLRLSSVGKKEKLEVLFNYLTSIEFKQKMEAIIEAFITMKSDLDQEKRLTMKNWAKREKQLERVIDNTTGMYGDLQGLIGKSLPQIPTLELPEPEDETL